MTAQSFRPIAYINPQRVAPGRCAHCGRGPRYRRKDGKVVYLGHIVRWGETLAWCCLTHAGPLRPRLRRTWKGRKIA